MGCTPDAIVAFTAAAAPAQPSVGQPLIDDSPDLSDVSTSHGRLSTSIPAGARDLWSTCLTHALASVVAHRDGRSWVDLLTKPALTLGGPSRGGRHHATRQAITVSRRCQDWLDGLRNPGLTSLPNSPDTHLPSSFFTTSLRRRLCVAIWDADSVCPLCGQTQDQWCDHALSYLCGGDRIGRHNAVRDVFHNIARDCCSLTPTKEKPGLLPPSAPDDGDLPPPPAEPDPSGRDLCCPADIWVPHGPSGLPEAWDFSIFSALCPSIWSKGDWDSGTVFQHVESRKSLFHDTAARCASTGLNVRPFVFEAVGGG